MASKEEMELVVREYKEYQQIFCKNYELLDIKEGNLLCYVKEDLSAQLSLQSYMYAEHRIAPVNLLPKVIDKMSTLYNKPPVRRVVGEDGETADNASVELLAWYEKQMNPNAAMSLALKLFNMCKSALIQPYLYKGVPSLRAIPNNSYFVLGLDPINPMAVTNVVTFDQTKEPNYQGGTKTIFKDYTEMQLTVFDDKPQVLSSEFNPYGKIPFIYTSMSQVRLFPAPDSDLLKMIKLLPVLLSDLNFAAMFQCFSILYGIDVDEQNIKFSPNAFWQFKSDPNSDKKPELGQLKPEVDIEQVLTLIQSQMALWLNSRGIRPGAVGDLNKDSFSSGISKIIDEMDTQELREQLIVHFGRVESDLWNLILKDMHPVWVANGLVENRTLFNPNLKVVIDYQEPVPLVSRGTKVAELQAEVAAGFTSRERAIKALNPNMSDDEVEALIEEIDGVVEEDAPDGGAAEDNTGDTGEPGLVPEETAS